MRTVAAFGPVDRRGGIARQIARGVWQLYWCAPGFRGIGIALLAFVTAMYLGLEMMILGDGSDMHSKFSGHIDTQGLYYSLFAGVQFYGPYLIAMKGERRSIGLLPLDARHQRSIVWLASVVMPGAVVFSVVAAMQVVAMSQLGPSLIPLTDALLNAFIVVGVRALVFQVVERAPNVTGWEVLHGLRSWHTLPGLMLVAALGYTWWDGFVLEARPMLALLSAAVALWALVPPNELRRAGLGTVNRPQKFQATASREISLIYLRAIGYGVMMILIFAPSWFVVGRVEMVMMPMTAPAIGAMASMESIRLIRGLRLMPLRTGTLAWAYLAFAAIAVVLPAIFVGAFGVPDIVRMRADGMSEAGILKYTNLLEVTWQHRAMASFSIFFFLCGSLACMYWQMAYGVLCMLAVMGFVYLSNAFVIPTHWDRLSYPASAINLLIGLPMLALATWGLHRHYFWKSTLYRAVQASGQPRPMLRNAEPDLFSKYVLPALIGAIVLVGFLHFGGAFSMSGRE